MADAPSERDNETPEPLEPAAPPAPLEPQPDRGWAGPTAFPEDDPDADGDSANPAGDDEAANRDINETDIL
jgi:hypothetical protein